MESNITLLIIKFPILESEVKLKFYKVALAGIITSFKALNVIIETVFIWLKNAFLICKLILIF